jgi:nitrate reductase gamma subunit
VTAFAYWLSGSIAGEKNANIVNKLIKLLRVLAKNILSPKILLIIKAMVMDVLLQRRLFIQSTGRWLIHSMIFFPFVFRFTWGILALAVSLWNPDWGFVWPMLNKNHPATAFLFDLTGIMLVIGVGLAFFRGKLNAKHQVSGLPRQDRLALSLIFTIVFLGFILEGMRISMTGIPSNSGYSFIGYAISKIFSGSNALANSYGYLWYAHAILTGAFIAYLPFSRLMHIILAPVVLSMNAVQGHEQRRK